jgi:hypothetical protein
LRLIRRVGPLLAVIGSESRGRVSNEDLEHLGEQFGIHPHWLVDFEAGPGRKPPLRRAGADWEITDFGEHIVDVWRSTEEREQDLQEAAWDFWREADAMSGERAAHVVGSADRLRRMGDEGLLRALKDDRYALSDAGHDWEGRLGRGGKSEHLTPVRLRLLAEGHPDAAVGLARRS